jgi:hypothetical protein
MTTVNNNKTEIHTLISRFVSEEVLLSEEKLLLVEQYLLFNKNHPTLYEFEELMETLRYLKDIMRRNQCKTLKALIRYFEKKEEQVRVLFDLLEKEVTDECYFIHFKRIGSMHMKPIERNHVFNQDCFYYLRNNTNSARIQTFKVYPSISDCLSPLSPEKSNGFIINDKSDRKEVKKCNGYAKFQVSEETIKILLLN